MSLVDQVLRRDPAPVYGRMDIRSRDRYRQAVEELAEPSGDAQLRLALRSIERARAAAAGGSAAHRQAHVGRHLVGKGRRDLETDVSYQPTLGARSPRGAGLTACIARLERTPDRKRTMERTMPSLPANHRTWPARRRRQ